MKKLFLICSLILFVYACACGQDTQNSPAAPEPEAGGIKEDGPAGPGNVTLDFKEADISNVLKIISYKSGVNIVTTPDVAGNVSVRLNDVPWEIALEVILKTYGFGYQKQGNIILVTKVENVAKISAEEPLQTEIITLKFLDAQDAQKILIPLLSPRGKISVLYTRGQKGWQF
ncbi:MAG: secretin and TonB N-terminal domain-containing protein, partial [Candidatus Omnitrophica bacterium]|nr:secretin and TonB N-terminal domain-containing protein [Candidatus Omnitrophota bacterium]